MSLHKKVIHNSRTALYNRLNMKEKITLNNVHTFSVPLSEHPQKYRFENEGMQLSDEFKDQIIPLTPEASKFLWEFETSQRHLGSIVALGRYFNEQSELSFGENEEHRVKKWLYERGIPFDQRVFWIHQSLSGFAMTWKMVIKFSEELFFSSDEVIWDRTLNWALIFNHSDTLYFGKNCNFKAEKLSTEIIETNKVINSFKKQI